MDIQFKKKRNQPLEGKITIPITRDVKSKIESIKESYKVDINEMVRGYLDQVIMKIEQGEYNPNA